MKAHALVSLCRYEELFDYPYTLPKLDILALPNYAFEAMENWVSNALCSP